MALYLCSRFCIFNRPILEEYVSQVEGAHICFDHVYMQHEMACLLQLVHFSFESLVVTSALGLQVSLMYIHHGTSIRFILEDDSISLASRIRIRSCSGKGARLWLIIRPFIYSFRIAHSTFTSTLHFHLGLIWPSTSNFFTCECGHELDASSTHLVHCPFGS